MKRAGLSLRSGTPFFFSLFFFFFLTSLPKQDCIPPAMFGIPSRLSAFLFRQQQLRPDRPSRFPPTWFPYDFLIHFFLLQFSMRSVLLPDEDALQFFPRSGRIPRNPSPCFSQKIPVSCLLSPSSRFLRNPRTRRCFTSRFSPQLESRQHIFH